MCQSRVNVRHNTCQKLDTPNTSKLVKVVYEKTTYDDTIFVSENL